MLNFLIDSLLPPIGLAAFALLLLVVGGRFARVVATIVIAVLVLFGLPPVANALLNALAPPVASPGPPPAAIVILSADGVRVDAAMDLDPGVLTLDRLRAGAELARSTGLPVLVSGGTILGSQTSLAEMMVHSLHDDFGITARWNEGRSRDTWENAEFSAAILKREGITRIYLVTHFWHMRRSLDAFRAFGMDPVPVSVRPPQWPPFRWQDLLPRVSAWFNTYLAFHEGVGLLYYSLR